MLVVQGEDAAKYVNAKQVDKAVWPPKCASFLVLLFVCLHGVSQHAWRRSSHSAFNACCCMVVDTSPVGVTANDPLCRYCKIELELSDGAKVAFCDSRRFARARFQVGNFCIEKPTASHVSHLLRQLTPTFGSPSRSSRCA